MAENLTPNEIAFQQKLTEQLQAQEASSKEQRALNDAILAAVNATLAKEGEASIADIFGAIQGVINDTRADMDGKVNAIKADLPKARAEGLRTKSSKAVKVGPEGAAESLLATAEALKSTISEQNVNAIVAKATESGLQTGAASLSLDAQYSADVVTELNHDVTDLKVTGSVHRLTQERFSQEGTLNKRYDFKTPGNIRKAGYNYSTFIVRSDLTDNGVNEWDTLDLYADSWLKTNNANGVDLPAVSNGRVSLPARHLPAGDSAKNRAYLTKWMVIANNLKDAKGTACDGSTFHGAVIHIGQRIALPEGEKISPKQAYMICTTCEVKTNEVPLHIQVGPVEVQQAPPAPPPVGAPPPPSFAAPREFIRQNAQSMEGGTYRQGSTELALEVNAQAGFNDAHYRIPQNVARKAVTTSNRSGEATPTYEGKHLFGDKIKSDDTFKRYKTNGNNLLEDVAFGYRSRVYVPGHGEYNEQGEFVRDTKHGWYKSHGAKEYATTVMGVRVPLGGFGGAPVGIAYTAPAKEEVLLGLTRREGITSSRSVGSVLDPEGRGVIFRNEYAKVTDEFTSPDRQNAATAMQAVEKAFKQAIVTLEDPATDAKGKQDAAKTALVALRDHSENMLEYRVDSGNIPGGKRYEATRALLLKYGVDESYIAKVEDDLKRDQIDPKTNDYIHNPRLKVLYMSKEQLEGQMDYKSDPTRFPDVSKCGTPVEGADTPQFRKDAYQTVTYFGQEVATGKYEDPKEEGVVPASRAVWEKVSKNPESVKAVADFVSTDRNARITMSELLHDVNRNPQEYFTREEIRNGTAKNLLQSFIGDGKEVKGQTDEQKQENAWKEEARNDVLRRGGTSPILFVKDGRQPNSQPELVAKLLDEKRKENPEAYEAALGNLLDRMSDPALGVDKKGKTNGYRYSLGLLRAYGAEQVGWGDVDGVMPPSFAKLAATLGDDSVKDAATKTVIDVVNYNETAASKRSSQGMQLLDNNFQQAQAQRLDNQQTFDLITSNAKSNQVSVLGLQDQMLGRDALLLAIKKHPEVFTDLGEKLVANGSPKFAKLDDAIDDSKKAFAKYAKTNDPEDLQKGIREYGDFFVHMAAKSTKRKGMVDERDWQNLVITVANDPAMNNAVIDAVRGYEPLRDAFTRNAYNSIRTAEDANHTNFVDVRKEASVAPLKQDENLSFLKGNDAYTSRFFSVATRDTTKQKDGGIKNKDGSVTTIEEDGTKVTELRNGSALTEQVDGTVTFVDAKQKSAITRHTDKSVSYIDANGKEQRLSADEASSELGAQLAKLDVAAMKAAEQHQLTAAASQKVDYRKGFLGLGGKNHVTQTDEQQVNFLRAIDAADGTELVKASKKQKDVVTKNKQEGSVTTTHADGTSETKLQDGTIVSKVGDTLITTLTDGSVQTKLANNTFFTESRDGSISLLNPTKQTTITRNADKSVNFKQSDGSQLNLDADTASKQLSAELQSLDNAKLQAASLRQLNSKTGKLDRATLEADEKLLNARAQAASVAFNLGETTKGNVRHDNPILTLSKDETAKIDVAKTPEAKLEAAAQLLVDRATKMAGSPEKLQQLSKDVNPLDGAKALIVNNNISLQNDEGILLTQDSFGLQSTDKLSQIGKAANISTAWLLLGLGFIGQTKHTTIIKNIIDYDCPGCHPIELPPVNPNMPNGVIGR